MKSEMQRETGIVATPAGRVRVSLMGYDRVGVQSRPRYLRVSGRRIFCWFVLVWKDRGWRVDPEDSHFRDHEGEPVSAALRARVLRIVEPSALEWVHIQPQSAWARADRFRFRTNKRGFISYDLPHLIGALEESAQAFVGVVRDREFGGCDRLYASLRETAGRCRDLLEEANALRREAAQIAYTRSAVETRNRETVGAGGLSR